MKSLAGANRDRRRCTIQNGNNPTTRIHEPRLLVCGFWERRAPMETVADAPECYFSLRLPPSMTLPIAGLELRRHIKDVGHESKYRAKLCRGVTGR